MGPNDGVCRRLDNEKRRIPCQQEGRKNSHGWPLSSGMFLVCASELIHRFCWPHGNCAKRGSSGVCQEGNFRSRAASVRRIRPANVCPVNVFNKTCIQH